MPADSARSPDGAPPSREPGLSELACSRARSHPADPATIILATVNPALHHPCGGQIVQPDRPAERRAAGRRFGPGFKDTDLVAFGGTSPNVMHCSSRGSTRSSTSGLTTARADRSSSRSAQIAEGWTSQSTRRRFRKPRPILARGNLNPAAIADAAARGWPVFTAIKEPRAAREQIAGYHAALAASGHDAETIRLAREWIDRWARRCTWRRPTNRRGRRPKLLPEPERGDRAQPR